MNSQGNKALKPYVGPEPGKTHIDRTVAWKACVSEYNEFEIPSDLKGGTFYLSKVSCGDFGSEIEIEYIVEKEVQNPRYKKEMDEYNLKLGKLKEWESEQAEIKKVEREKSESEEYAKYLELKGKYDDK